MPGSRLAGRFVESLDVMHVCDVGLDVAPPRGQVVRTIVPQRTEGLEVFGQPTLYRLGQELLQRVEPA